MLWEQGMYPALKLVLQSLHLCALNLCLMNNFGGSCINQTWRDFVVLLSTQLANVVRFTLPSLEYTVIRKMQCGCWGQLLRVVISLFYLCIGDSVSWNKHFRKKEEKQLRKKEKSIENKMDDQVIYFSKAKFSSLKSISELCGVGRDDTSKKNPGY